MLSFGVFLLIVSSCSALSIQQLLLGDDGTTLVDSVITSLRLQSAPEIPAPDFAFTFNVPTGKATDTKVGNLSASQGRVYNFQSFKRNGPVVSILSTGNLTLQTNIVFDKLGAKYNVVDLNVFGVHTQVQADVSVSVNQFYVDLTIYSKKTTGKCAVDLQTAAFTTLSGIKVSLTPLGFFNQITLNADIFHVTEEILTQFNKLNIAGLQNILEAQICSNIPN